MDEQCCEELGNRLAALHQASLELVQEMSLDSLLQRIAEIACEQVDARYAAVGVIDTSGGLEKFIPVGMTPEEINLMEFPPKGLGLIGQLMHVKEPLRLKEIKGYPNSVGFPKDHPVMTSFLGVPIRLGDVSLGQIYLTDKKSAPEFSENDTHVIQMLAAYAAVAIAHARTYQELSNRDKALTRRNQDLALLNDLANTLASSLDPKEIIEKSLQRVMENPQIAAAELFLKDEEVQELRLEKHLGEFAGTLWLKNQFEPGEGPVGKTASTGIAQLFDIPGEIGRFLKQDVRTSDLSQLGCFPLPGRSGSQGVLCLATMPYKFMDEHEITLFSAIGMWVGTAIENVRLYNQGRRLAILEERERIGMDLHDGVIQSIYAVGLGLEHARLLMPEDITKAENRIRQAIADLNHTIRDIRAYILDLRPRQMNEENFVDGIRHLIEDFHTNTQIAVEFDLPEEDIHNLPQSHRIVLFHICQEGLANIAKHAHATQVKINLWKAPDRVLLEIHDNGNGFDPLRTSLTRGHGLGNMHTRTRNVGGDVEISSDADEGTTIMAWVPFRENY